MCASSLLLTEPLPCSQVDAEHKATALVLFNFDNVTTFAKTEGLAWPYNTTSKARLFQQFEAGCAQHPDGGIVALSEGRAPKTMADFKTALGL